ncbi:hypothetical protein FFLO_05748 [Filobasidium floriforme]|uniref:Nitrate reductase [NADPH] n=1 Tax=Filobasidium floriforme TaxID=5210 RepID=A0A8K0JHM0_9TREE|nr:hypothetical protein FFLO_05748 [Filobasidium floriforme]
MSTSTSSNSSSSPNSPSKLGDSLTLPNSSSGETSPATSVPSSPDLDKDVKPEYDLEIEEKDDEDTNGFPASFPAVPKSTTYNSPDEKDAGTPDAWLNRDPRLVRLTGKHPFNCEPKLNTLFDQGFLTPSELFYVRNHGAVPKVDEQLAASWKVEVTGQVKNPIELSLRDLKERFKVVTLPVTLVCAGNRRKEQNVVRKGLGFNWGAAGVSTALFTGVYLADILDLVKPIPHPETGARAAHVVFEGADDLPQGRYGTSQLLSWARNRERGMLIAWAMNGEPLSPDHGFPIRLVCPGQIGGRMVKWLTKIEVSHQESQHYLHFWDNKVLPTQVMPEEARAEKKWWYDPRYIINELNTNSAIAQPDHDEVINLDTLGSEYTVKGYAYSGGGRRVNRIEVSLDEGTTWKLAEIFYPEDLYRAVAYQDETYGHLDLTDRDTCFCWCFWSFKIPSSDLKTTPAIMVRAMDEGLSGQPQEMYWNATSMMNNWWFRVAVHQQEDGRSVRFEHPTLAGVHAGGWMERLKDEGQDILKPVFGKKADAPGPSTLKPTVKKEVSMVKESIKRIITAEELKAHTDPEHPWFVVRGEVYDGSGFMKDHPGGGESISLVAGQDATEDFMSIHSPQGRAMLADYHIGTLDARGLIEAVSEPQETQIEPIFLNKTKWKKAPLVSVKTVSHDSRVYRFALQDKDQTLGLPTGQHVFVKLRRKAPRETTSEEDRENAEFEETRVVEGEMVQRAYTPVSSASATGHIDLLIKLYLANETWRNGGKMTTGFNELELGDEIEFKGPLGSFTYLERGLCRWRGVERKVNTFGMICAGSGITPILQVVREIVDGDARSGNSHQDLPKVWCVDSNRKEEDILCRQELDGLVERSQGRFQLHHALSAPPFDWPETYTKGRMTENTLRQYLPPPSDDALLMVCGPDGLINEIVKPGLTAIGWNIETQLVVF